MSYYIFHIPSTSFPADFTKINESVYCFPSKLKYTCTDYKMHENCICLVINSDTEKIVLKNVKDFILILNVFRQEHEAIKWFSGINLKEHSALDDTIENIYSQFKAEGKIGFYHDDFNDMTIHVHYFPQPKFPFIDILNKFSSLPESAFLYKSLSYLAIINPIILFTSRFYDNALFETSMLFQLFESIMKEYETVPEAKVKHCPTCNKPIEKGINQRIRNYLNTINFKDDETKEVFITSIQTVYKSRNMFLHALKGKSITDYYKEIEPMLGADKTIYFKEDIKHGYGVFNAVYNLKTINRILLIGKLLSNSTD